MKKDAYSHCPESVLVTLNFDVDFASQKDFVDGRPCRSVWTFYMGRFPQVPIVNTFHDLSSDAAIALS